MSDPSQELQNNIDAVKLDSNVVEEIKQETTTGKPGLTSDDQKKVPETLKVQSKDQSQTIASVSDKN